MKKSRIDSFIQQLAEKCFFLLNPLHTRYLLVNTFFQAIKMLHKNSFYWFAS